MISASEAREIVRSVISQEKLIPQVVNEEMIKCDYIVRKAAEQGKTTAHYTAPNTYGVHTLSNASREHIAHEITKLLIRRGYSVGPCSYDIQIYWHETNKENGD